MGMVCIATYHVHANYFYHCLCCSHPLSELRLYPPGAQGGSPQSYRILLPSWWEKWVFTHHAT